MTSPAAATPARIAYLSTVSIWIASGLWLLGCPESLVAAHVTTTLVLAFYCASNASPLHGAALGILIAAWIAPPVGGIATGLAVRRTLAATLIGRTALSDDEIVQLLSRSMSCGITAGLLGWLTVIVFMTVVGALVGTRHTIGESPIPIAVARSGPLAAWGALLTSFGWIGAHRVVYEMLKDVSGINMLLTGNISGMDLVPLPDRLTPFYIVFAALGGAISGWLGALALRANVNMPHRHAALLFLFGISLLSAMAPSHILCVSVLPAAIFYCVAGLVFLVARPTIARSSSLPLIKTGNPTLLWFSGLSVAMLLFGGLAAFRIAMVVELPPWPSLRVGGISGGMSAQRYSPLDVAPPLHRMMGGLLALPLLRGALHRALLFRSSRLAARVRTKEHHG